MMRSFSEMFLRARRALEFSHGQDPLLLFDNGFCCNAQSVVTNCVVMCSRSARRREPPMRRRDLITLIGAAAAWPLAARAQQAGKVLRVGTVSGQPRSSPWQAFDQRMIELGHEEGRNLALDYKQAASVEEFESGYREAVAHKVDI